MLQKRELIHIKKMYNFSLYNPLRAFEAHLIQNLVDSSRNDVKIFERRVSFGPFFIRLKEVESLS